MKTTLENLVKLFDLKNSLESFSDSVIQKNENVKIGNVYSYERRYFVPVELVSSCGKVQVWGQGIQISGPDVVIENNGHLTWTSESSLVNLYKDTGFSLATFIKHAPKEFKRIKLEEKRADLANKIAEIDAELEEITLK